MNRFFAFTVFYSACNALCLDSKERIDPETRYFVHNVVGPPVVMLCEYLELLQIIKFRLGLVLILGVCDFLGQLFM